MFSLSKAIQSSRFVMSANKVAAFSNIHSGLDSKGMYQKMILDPNKNKYQEN
jgi:hypothetical protein